MARSQAVRHFERAAEGYGGFRSTWPLGVLRRRERTALQEIMNVQPGDRVLDAGCGDGELLSWLAAAGARSIGIDVAHSMARQSHGRGFPVAVQDIEQPGLRPVFDWVLCFGALEFTARPARAIGALALLLRRGGSLVLLYPQRNWLGALYALYHRVHGVRIHRFTRNEVTAFVRAGGLEAPSAWRDCSLSALCVARRGGA